MGYKVTRNYDYTISIEDSRGKQIKLRDICGNDLEFLESIISPNGDEKQTEISFDNLIQILNLLSVISFDFKSLPRRISVKLFNILNQQILINYMPKYTWLTQCYVLQDGSFSGVTEMEKVPMTKFVAMMQIHENATKSIDNSSPIE